MPLPIRKDLLIALRNDTGGVSASIYLLADHLDAALAAGEDLLAELASLSAGGGREAPAAPGTRAEWVASSAPWGASEPAVGGGHALGRVQLAEQGHGAADAPPRPLTEAGSDPDLASPGLPRDSLGAAAPATASSSNPARIEECGEATPTDGGQEPRGGDVQRHELRKFVARVRSHELLLITRLLAARERAKDVRRSDSRLRTMAALFHAGTSLVADAIEEDWGAVGRELAGAEGLDYLLARNLVPAATGLDAVRELRADEVFLVAGRAPLGTLLDLLAAFLDQLEAHYELFPVADGDLPAASGGADGSGGPAVEGRDEATARTAMPAPEGLSGQNTVESAAAGKAGGRPSGVAAGVGGAPESECRSPSGGGQASASEGIGEGEASGTALAGRAPVAEGLSAAAAPGSGAEDDSRAQSPEPRAAPGRDEGPESKAGGREDRGAIGPLVADVAAGSSPGGGTDVSDGAAAGCGAASPGAGPAAGVRRADADKPVPAATVEKPEPQSAGVPEPASAAIATEAAMPLAADSSDDGHASMARDGAIAQPSDGRLAAMEVGPAAQATGRVADALSTALAEAAQLDDQALTAASHPVPANPTCVARRPLRN